MKKILGAGLVFVGMMILFPPTMASNAATLEIKGKCTIVLTGEIDQFTDTDLVARYQALGDGHPEKCHLPSLELDSNGGDVDAAMRAGDFIRQKNFSTMVWENKSCASACVLLFLAGVNRHSIGNIGLHRPFLDKYSASESEARDIYEETNRQIRQYLHRMNIPERILDVMNSVPPGEIKWLTPDDDSFLQLEELNITGEDPVFADQRDSRIAKRFGISKREYYSREQTVKSVCPELVGPRADHSISLNERIERRRMCYEDIMNGHSPGLDVIDPSRWGGGLLDDILGPPPRR